MDALRKYQALLDHGTFDGGSWPAGQPKPLGRSHTVRRAFELVAATHEPVVVELGTIRSYTHGGLPSCNTDDLSAWTPDEPANWDWGAGCFSRVAAEVLAEQHPIIHTVDASKTHMDRCTRVTARFSHLFRYHVMDSRAFLRRFAGAIDLLYLDTGDMTPIEPTARVQLDEATIVVSRELVSPGGVLLIDDVRNPTPAAYGDTSGLGKSKYSLPYLLAHGFVIDMDEYQVLLTRYC